MNVLAFFSHPDDETILAGGTLAALAHLGAAVHYLCATRGEGGEVGDPPVCTPQELGAVREQELVCAVRALGGRSLTFLGYEDPRVGPDEALYAFTDDLAMLSGQIVLSIQQMAAVALITHGSNGEYGHPAHLLAHRAALAAVSSVEGTRPLLYTVGATFAGHPYPRLSNRDDPADLVIDISDFLTQKIEAALCHRTQAALFVRRASEEAGRQLTVPEAVGRMVPESLHRALPAGGERETDAIARLLAEAGLLLSV